MSRLTDNDKKFMGITYGKSKWDAFRIVVSSGDEEERETFQNTLTLYSFGRVFRVNLPNLIEPYRIKHTPISWSEEDIKRIGRNYYYETHPKQYGVTVDDGYVHLYYGAQTHCSTSTKSKCWSIPWMQWRWVRTSFYDPDGYLWWSNYSGSLREAWETQYEMQQSCPKSIFLVEDFDQTKVNAECYIRESEWHFGEGWFKWLRFFRKPMIRRVLEIKFDQETGREKGSWKGGTTGTSIEMLSKETPVEAFKRFCQKDQYSKHGNSKLTFKEQIDE